MRRFIAAVFLVFAIALLPVAASADDGSNKGDDFLIKADGSLTIAADQVVGTVMAIDSNVQIDGSVKRLIVVDGDVTINGQVTGRITMLDGHLNLGPTAQVHSIDRIGGVITQADGAVVAGSIRQRDDFALNGIGYVLGAIVWVAFTMVVLSAGIVFALFGGRQLKQAASAMSGRPAEGFAAGVVFWIAAPVVAIALMLTIVGIPLGLAVLLVVLPSAFLLGYTVAAYKLGSFLAAKLGKGSSEATVVPAIAGLVILQAVVMIPVAGVVIAIVAATLGAGALLLAIAGSMHHQPMTPGVAV